MNSEDRKWRDIVMSAEYKHMNYIGGQRQKLETSHDGKLVLDDPVWTWGVINGGNNPSVGNCEQRNGKMTLLADGTASWSCNVLTYHTHSGDMWRSGFELRGSDGQILAESYFITGPDHMNDGDPPPVYPWNDTVIFDRAYDRFAVNALFQYSTC